MEIKIYTIPSCPWCEKAKEWLKKKKYSFQELDVSESNTYRDELLDKTSQLAVPVFDIEGICVVGFDEKKIEEAIQKVKDQ